VNYVSQKVLLLLTALLLAATQNYSANFCSCVGEIFESVCPCIEEVEETVACCSTPVDCTETIEFDWGNYLPNQNDSRLSLEGVDLDNIILSAVDQLVSIRSVTALGANDSVPPPELLLRENYFFAKFVSLRV
jgi:hypothetical protein